MTVTKSAVCVTLLGVAIMLGVVLAGGDALAANGDASGAPEPAAQEAVRCGALLDRLPPALRADVATLREASPEQREAALLVMRARAAEGAYGDQVQRLATLARGEVTDRPMWKLLPEDLRSDLRAVRALPVGERRQELATIAESAAGGAYGSQVQLLAARAQARIEACG